MSADILTPAILQHIENGAYPDSEEVSSASLQPTTLANVLSELHREQDSVKEEIRTLSQNTAPDIDTWISRAKDLQADIQRSRDTAREIVAEAEAGRDVREKVKDAGNKVGLLEREVGFNEALTGTLEHVRYAHGISGEVKEAIVQGRLERALERLEGAEASVGGLRGVEGSKAVGLLVSRVGKLREELVERTGGMWNEFVKVDFESKKIVVKEAVEDQEEAGMQQVVNTAAGLDVLPKLLQKLGRDIDRSILRALMSKDKEGRVGSIVVVGDELRCERVTQYDHSSTLFRDLKAMIDFVAGHLPQDVAEQLSGTLAPAMTSRLEDYWLEPSVPLEMSQMSAFESTLNSVLDLAQHIEKCSWKGASELRSWVNSAPRTWLTKRRETVLGDVRNLVFTGLRDQKTVERVETQMLSKGDALAGGTEGDEDDWDTAWDEPEEETTAPVKNDPSSQKPAPEDDDDEASAWDTDDLGEDEKKEEKQYEEKKEDDGGEDAWGWGDEDGSQRTSSPLATRSEPAKSNGETTEAKRDEREMTLRETYTVTAIPDAILSTIQQVISDAQALSGPEYSSSPIAPAATGLYTLPTLALAIYRATAPTAYTKVDTGNMLIYNDASRLSEQLRSWQASQPPSSRLRLDSDATALDQFAKRAYSAEMESQRTILRDLLDGAQGFANCTVAPFKGECESAVEQTIDRLREVHRQWSPVLAQSALLQSLGSLLSSVTTKMISDIEDLGDISEPDSQQLKRLCEQLVALKDLFTAPAQAPGEAPGDMTFVYCPNWLKFQYLEQILESSLADIRFLWNEGELSLEFDAEEVVELVEALFAESELRKKAVGEIRRGGR